MTTETVSLWLGDRPVAEYAWQPSLPETVSPRPFLHPVRTFASTEVTESMPADHLHHIGVSVAVADVGGVNFWGGRTFVPGRGPMHLPNHGTQRHHRWTTRNTTSVRHELRWLGPAGTDLVRERRRIAAIPVDDMWFVRSRDYAGVGSSLAWDSCCAACAAGAASWVM